ncbi:MAG: hypothetical protein ABIT96_03470 [Ferruginibacter sp.]
MKQLRNFFIVFLLLSAGCGQNNTANTEGVKTADSVAIQDNTNTRDPKMDTSKVLDVDTTGKMIPPQ